MAAVLGLSMFLPDSLLPCCVWVCLKMACYSCFALSELSATSRASETGRFGGMMEMLIADNSGASTLKDLVENLTPQSEVDY